MAPRPPAVWAADRRAETVDAVAQQLQRALDEALTGTGALASVTVMTGTPPLRYAEEAERVARAVPKRVREFATGRALAHDLLDRLGAPAAALLPGDRRQPLWPAGFSGSISHCDELCAAVVAPASRLPLLGLDLEEDLALPAGVLTRVLTAQEIDGLERLSSLGRRRRPRLTFSAKETFYKALAPRLERVLAFDEVSVDWGQESEERGSFQARFVQAEARPAGCPPRLAGSWWSAPGALLTLAASPLDGPADPGVDP